MSLQGLLLFPTKRSITTEQTVAYTYEKRYTLVLAVNKN